VARLEIISQSPAKTKRLVSQKQKRAGRVSAEKQIPETKILELPLLFFNWEPIR